MDSTTTRHERAVRTQLDATVIGIELTLISIIQGLALGVLVTAAIQPLLQLQWETWPYVLTGLATILVFWSRSLVHTLSFIGWPLEFGHTFLYFAATLIEAAALSQVSVPEYWFALNTAYAACVWILYAWDLRVVRAHAPDFISPGERALLDDVIADQQLNLRWLMPLAIGFQGVSWWLVHAWPAPMLRGHWHLLLIGASLAFTLNYLHGGVRLLRRRQRWIVERAAQERAVQERAEAGDAVP
jgi:hypothetical protein